ncbi:merozoite surface protein 10, putative [Plasmodium berghei]|uniref:Merozoite surface protein 10, putative n=2 Tax=Plasmodium berghei TaxID=5821 RepID=A0A509AKM5_PLABA|nr:merozoite surface protein 10, putative [Plasmodium berghei ANKA]SCM23810.1 merozoite surface protein 10, putative [Plasmodium berghei]SCN26786.1 merozoite surface protein 10, putative [Plasmodium berghei]SCO61128.1 merozoite surface protein 10, putative [Plasmodium berghei]SCO63205.1 merozoite surface protein 10, putative [Plasmodium berghei]VUC56617.1 merozoite surface protein 10, putative [Plasmodium berghei ANKA]|eukprot:XP_034422403.1 merozoite surface protein 10, putative [Plasmodium berghei ANKA]
MILAKRNKLFTLSFLLLVYANNVAISSVNDKNNNITITSPSQENNEENVIEEIENDDINMNDHINMKDEDEEINNIKETYFIRKENYNNTTQNEISPSQNKTIEDLKEKQNSDNVKIDAFNFIDSEKETIKNFHENIENNKTDINNEDDSFLGKLIRIIPNLANFGKIKNSSYDHPIDQNDDISDFNKTVEGEDDDSVQVNIDSEQKKSDNGNTDEKNEISTEPSNDTNALTEQKNNNNDVKNEEDISVNNYITTLSLKSNETPNTTIENNPEKKNENTEDIIDHADIMRITLLKENKNLKETTKMLDEAVYNIERFVLKCKFYITAITNFIKFKTNHICEYSKCGDNARCYIVEKDRQECRCLANYVRDTSVEYFKCIPMTIKDCANNNGNCDKNAECSIKNDKIICHCSYDYFGDGTFCVPNSHYNNLLHISLIIIGCIVQKFIF